MPSPTRLLTNLAVGSAMAILAGLADAAPPTADAIDPGEGKSGEPTHVRLVGAGFEPGARVNLLDGGIHIVEQLYSTQLENNAFAVDVATHGTNLWALVYRNHVGASVMRCHAGVPMDCQLNGEILSAVVADHIAVTDDYVFVQSLHELAVVDRALFDSPRAARSTDDYVRRISFPDFEIQSVTASGTRAFLPFLIRDIPDGNSGFITVDASGFPHLDSWVEFDGSSITCVYGSTRAYGDHLFVDRCYGFDILDVSDPAAPTAVGAYELDGLSRGLAFDGGHGYMLTRHPWSNRLELLVLDVSDPSAPVLQGSCLLPAGYDAADLSVSGGTALVFGSPDSTLSYELTTELFVIDVADPTDPEQIASYSGFDRRGRLNSAASERYLFVPGPGKLTAIDFSEVRAPDPVVSSIDRLYATGLALSGDRLFMWARGGLEILEIGDPTSLTSVGLSDEDLYRSWEIEIQDRYAFVGAITFDTAGDFATGIRVLDVSDPSRPTSVGLFVEKGWTFITFAVAGDVAYLIDRGGDLRIVDVSDPTAPTLIASHDLDLDYVGHIGIQGHFLHIASNSNIARIDVFDVGDPSSPEHIATYGPNLVRDLVVIDDLAVVATWDRIDIFDVGDPSTARLIGTYTFQSNVSSLAANDGLLYVSLNQHGFRVVDLATPSAPVLVGSHDVWTRYEGVVGTGEYAFVASPLTVSAVRLNTPIRDVSTPRPTELTFTVPPDTPLGFHHVQVTNPGGEADTLFNAFEVYEPADFAAVLQRLGPAAAGNAWRVRCSGDVSFFEPEVRHDATLLLPDIPHDLRIEFVPGIGDGSTSFELSASPTTESGVVVVIGDDREASLALWNEAVQSGGWRLPRLDAYRYGDFELEVIRRTPTARPGVLPPGPSVDSLNGTSFPLRYRYALDGSDALVAARAAGVDVDLVIEVRAENDSGGKAVERLSVFDAAHDSPTIRTLGTDLFFPSQRAPDHRER